MKDADDFVNASKYKVKNLWTKEESVVEASEVAEKGFNVSGLAATDNLTLRITPM